jgi:hypothetical protein
MTGRFLSAPQPSNIFHGPGVCFVTIISNVFDASTDDRYFYPLLISPSERVDVS